MGRRPGPSLDRQQVVDGAIAVVMAEGAGALGVSRVAKALGIKPPSIYNHVGKGAALARAVLVEGNRRLADHLEQAVRGEADPAEQLRTLASAYRAWVLDHAPLYEVMSTVPPDNEDPAFRPVLLRILDLFERPLGQLGLPADEHLHAIRSLRASLQGYLLLESQGQFTLATDSADSFRWMVEALIARAASGAG